MKIHEILIEQDQDMQQQLDQAAKQIVRDCQPYLNEIDLNEETEFLYRGIETSNELFINRRPRKNRQPMDTPQVMQDAADQVFKEKFGYPYRAAGVFTTGHIGESISYGNSYIVFPVGNFNYIWSPEYDMLFPHLFSAHRHALHMNDMREPEEQDAYQMAKEIIERGNYIHNQNIQSAIASENEVLIGTDRFYGIRVVPEEPNTKFKIPSPDMVLHVLLENQQPINR